MDYVVVSIATNGVIHAWGWNEGQRLRSRPLANRLVDILRKSEIELYGESTTKFKICKVLKDNFFSDEEPE